MSFSVRPGHIFRKPFLIALRRISVVGVNSSACKYCASYGLDACSIMLFTAVYYYCVTRGTSHIPVLLFLLPLIIPFPLFWTEISYFSSVMVHPLSHKTYNYNSGDVFIFG